MDILFICTHNRCRSILAEAISNHLARQHSQTLPHQQGTNPTNKSVTENPGLRAFSAGSQPAGKVHPLSLKYLKERGISAEGLTSQSWDDFAEQNIDVAVTVCDSAAAEQCPLWMGDGIKIHWGLPDPSKLANDKHIDEDKIRDAFFAVMDTLQHRIEKLLAADINNMSKQELERFLQSLSAE